MKYVAFLRGINVGGNSTVKMEELRKAFEKLGFQNVKTLLNSGNVLFDPPVGEIKTTEKALKQKIEESFDKKFGFNVTVITRSLDDIGVLVNSNPFKNIEITSETRLHVTFLNETTNTALKFPHQEKDFQILGIFDKAVCSVVTLTENTNTTDLMKVLEKEFGKKITTRTWNTLNRILKGF